jgi:hypothetical protein
MSTSLVLLEFFVHFKYDEVRSVGSVHCNFAGVRVGLYGGLILYQFNSVT